MRVYVATRGARPWPAGRRVSRPARVAATLRPVFLCLRPLLMAPAAIVGGIRAPSAWSSTWLECGALALADPDSRQPFARPQGEGPVRVAKRMDELFGFCPPLLPPLRIITLMVQPIGLLALFLCSVFARATGTTSAWLLSLLFRSVSPHVLVSALPFLLCHALFPLGDYRLSVRSIVQLLICPLLRLDLLWR